MLRTFVLTVFTETDSSLAISGLDRFVGRYRNTLNSHGLSSSVSGDGCLLLAVRDEPCTTSMGIASAVNNDVSRFGSLLAVAVLPAVGCNTGTLYLRPDALAAGFRALCSYPAGLCAAGRLLAAVTTTNAERVPRSAGGVSAIQCRVEMSMPQSLIANHGHEWREHHDN
jgi:hypothetical protein